MCYFFIFGERHILSRTTQKYIFLNKSRFYIRYICIHFKFRHSVILSFYGNYIVLLRHAEYEIHE